MTLPSRWVRTALMVLPLVLSACSSAPKAPQPAAYPALPQQPIALQQIWSVNTGAGVGESHLRLNPAINEQRIFTTNRYGVLQAYARDTGARVWKKKTGITVVAGPAAAYGIVVVCSAKGDVLAYAQSNGDLLWKTTLDAVVTATPAISANSVVVLAGDGVIHALARDTGASKWTYKTVMPSLSLRLNAAPLVNGDSVYVATSGGKLLALNLETGIANWELRVATNNGRTELERMADISADMLLQDDGTLYSVGFQSQLTATDVVDSRRRWQQDFSGVNAVAAQSDKVFAVDTNGQIIALDALIGKSVWTQKDFKWRVLTNPVVLDSVVVVADNNGRLHIMDSQSGAVRGRAHWWWRDIVSLQTRDNTLYAWDRNGRLSAWRLANKQ